MEKLRNILICAHIDHGKSTLADRMLELTHTVESRKMKAQYLDSMELERERGITIKMTPVRMDYKGHTLNLIDTPGHSDFSYEVSRALQAVEGAIVLVDASQGIQAQTLSNFESARKAGLKIIGVANKIDMATSEQIDDTILDLSELIGCDPDEILKCSGKTGEGVIEILDQVIERVPAPKEVRFDLEAGRALIFDSQYDEHRGVIAFIRVFSGEFNLNGDYYLATTDAAIKAKDLGYLRPEFSTDQTIKNGEIGYIATGIKDPDLLNIGDTISDIRPTSESERKQISLPGYQQSRPVVFVTFYPEHSEDYDEFKRALAKLRLSDSALFFEPDMSEVLGRGFKGGFLGRLHYEITVERLTREFDIPVISSFPSVAYQVKFDPKMKTENIELEPVSPSHPSRQSEAEAGGGPAEDGYFWVKNPRDFPENPAAVKEPISRIEILTPIEYMGPILALKELYRISDIETKNLSAKKILISAKLPVADLISDFDDKLKSVSQGYGSLSYEIIGYETARVDKMEILVAESVMPGLTRILPKSEMEAEARKAVQKLKELLPKQQFSQAIQARFQGRIIARETQSAFRKELGNFGKNGGDRTRKMKLWKKQQRGKERLKERGVSLTVSIPQSVFKELLKK